jgi:hypothetical protein
VSEGQVAGEEERSVATLLWSKRRQDAAAIFAGPKMTGRR